MHVDVAVVGGGIAGVTAAAHVSSEASVALIEAEETLAHHTTGRSAAMFLESYGTTTQRRLTLASRDMLEHPPEGTTDGPLLTPRSMMSIGTDAQSDALDQDAARAQKLLPSIQRIDSATVRELCPVLKPEATSGGGVFEATAQEMDVMGLHQAFVRLGRSNGMEILRNAPVTDIARVGRGWQLQAGDTTVHAGTIVNAAGAWGDALASMVGAVPVHLTPMRRTAFTITVGADVPDRDNSDHWPLVHAIDEAFYFKPEPGHQLLCSLADETPDHPHDVKPEEIDVAEAIHNINGSTELGIRAVNTAWAGLRTFAPDRDLVLGPDPEVDRFFWMVGQGGTGIQTAPAAGRAVAGLLLHGALPDDLVALGVTPDHLGPARLRSADA